MKPEVAQAIEYIRSTVATLPEPAEGSLILTPDTCRTLEETLGLGATRDEASLIKAVQRLAKITIGRIEIHFTPGQMEELSRRAEKNGRTVKQELQGVVKRIEQELFWGGRAG